MKHRGILFAVKETLNARAISRNSKLLDTVVLGVSSNGASVLIAGV